jgi:16S rRNA C967 or C1407 C5-methylase (RsmB/RsmF family)
MPVRMLAPHAGHRVLDLCAAPGNKTVQLALVLGNRGTLIANDIKMVRLSAVHDQCRRLGLLNVSTTGHDGSVYPVDDAQFDRILVDAPCTAEGKARRGYMRASKPGFRSWVAGQQRALLRRALELCRPGGRIVYATCTFAPEENEAVISDLLTTMDGRVRAIAPDFEVPGAAPGLASFDGARYHRDLRHARRLWPQRTDTGGFFAVTLERIDAFPGETWQAHVAGIMPATGSEFSLLPAQNSSGNWIKVVQRIRVNITLDDYTRDLPISAGMSAVVDIDTGRSRALPWIAAN